LSVLGTNKIAGNAQHKLRQALWRFT